jgi:hypothetical protein
MIMRKHFTKGQSLKMKNMNTGNIIDVTVLTARGKSFTVRGGGLYGNLKYYKKLGTYTASEGMTAGKCLDRYILVEETA